MTNHFTDQAGRVASDSHDLTVAHEALWEAVEDGDAARLAAVFGAVPGLRDVVNHIHPHSPFAAYALEPVLQMDNPFLLTYPLHHSAHLGYDDVCAVLLDNGATLDGRLDSETPLSIAVQNGKLTVAQFLLDRGADPDGRLREPERQSPAEGEYQGKPSDLGPLHYAAQRGEEQMVGLLLERGATCDLADAEGNTALHHAGRVNAVEVACRLMTAGGDEHRRNGNGETPFEVASALWGVLPTEEIDNWSAAGVMRFHTLLMGRFAANKGDEAWEMAAIGISTWIPPSWRGGPWVVSPWAGELWDALHARDTPTAFRLVSEDPRLARARHPCGRTALHLSVYDGELTRVLIEQGADTTARDAAGDTALHHAARQSSDEAAWHLLKAGASSDVINRGNLLPYDIAHGHPENMANWSGGWVAGTWECAIPPGLLFGDIGRDLDYAALRQVRCSEETCCGSFMAVVLIRGKDVLVCPNPACLNMMTLTDTDATADDTNGEAE